MKYFNYEARDSLTGIFRTRIMARHIASLTNNWTGGQNYNEVLKMVQSASNKFRHPKLERENNTPFSEATWSRWFNGKNIPGPSSIAVLDMAFNNIASYWLRPNMQNAISRNLVLLDALHEHVFFDYQAAYGKLSQELSWGLNMLYASKSRQDFPGNEFRITDAGTDEGYRDLNYMDHLNPGDPYSLQLSYLSFILEDCDPDDPNLDIYAFDYVSISIFQYKYAERFIDQLFIPKGKGISLARASMAHLFLGSTKEELEKQVIPAHCERITENLIDSGINVGLGHVEKTLNKLKFSYYDSLAQLTGLTPKQVMKTITPDFGF